MRHHETARAVNRLQRGFTLIELIIAVGIVGILAAVALPSYRDYIRRGQLTEAFTYLSDYRVKMEQYYQDNKNYGPSGGACANGTNAPAWKTFAPTGVKYFAFSCAQSANTYTLTATGNGGAAIGHVYTVTQDNVQATTQFKGVSVSKTCWLVKGSEC